MSINIHKRLIKKGYFPEEMGFWFSSESFAKEIDFIDRNIILNKKKISKLVKYSIPKGRYNRRNLGLINPYHYFFLCKEIHENWSDIEDHLKKSDISLTIPVFKSGTSRAISRRYTFEDISGIFLTKSVGANYVLKTDISRYFTTIYTHSIPWALHSKATAKKNRSDSLLGNLLDKIIRNSQDGQTIGIPIGPDTSLIISEIIGVAMDDIVMKSTKCLSAFRYVDDYYLFYNKLADAESTLGELQRVINEYELDLNKEKTDIYEMPQSLEPKWVSNINNATLDNSNITSFISITYALIKEYPNESVLKYSLARIKKLAISKKNWPLVQAFVLNSIIYDSTAMPLACSILSEYYHKKYGINESEVIKVIDNIIDKALYTNYDYELLWALWLGKLLDVKLKDEMLSKVCLIDSPIIALIILSDYKHSGKLDTTRWEEHMTKEDLYSEYWILAYEALVRGWLPSKSATDYIEEDQFFKALKDKNVRFFDTNCRSKWIDNNIDEKWLSIFSPAF
ncbi:hypothetical protein A0J52_06870 [Clostridium sporogenes]|uniref:RNA-directed DNA polymerase n=1 Tax=Clostridium sporogenes TaxID=1509 RepID=UPI0007801026|nr:RNA-directed DNA polymerase [Clostridium sporogenes]KYN78992.1 hypothetical protein A0J52_06870 [Clostridium sporogenes]MBW5459314.1 hypothetical protein [Clostridium sporogenes]